MGGYKKVVIDPKAPVGKIDNSHSIVYCLFNSSHISGTIIAVVIGLAFVIYLCRIRCGRGCRALQGKQHSPETPQAPTLPPHPLQPNAALVAQHSGAMGTNMIPYHPQELPWIPSMSTSVSAPMLMSRPALPAESTGQ